MNYTKNYLLGAQILDAELEQFNHNPSDFVESMRWSKEMQDKAETVKDKLELVKKDYTDFEKIFDNLEAENPEFGEMELLYHDSVQDYVTNLFAGKILAAIN